MSVVDVFVRPPGWPPRWGTPGAMVDGAVHLAEPAPGWRCTCGSLATVMLLPGQVLQEGAHYAVPDEVSPADSTVCFEYLAAFSCTLSESMWVQFITRAHDPRIAYRCIRELSGINKELDAECMVTDLLTLAVPLSTTLLDNILVALSLYPSPVVRDLALWDAHPSMTNALRVRLLTANHTPLHAAESEKSLSVAMHALLNIHHHRYLDRYPGAALSELAQGLDELPDPAWSMLLPLLESTQVPLARVPEVISGILAHT